jgi:hypothetical protein
VALRRVAAIRGAALGAEGGGAVSRGYGAEPGGDPECVAGGVGIGRGRGAMTWAMAIQDEMGAGLPGFMFKFKSKSKYTLARSSEALGGKAMAPPRKPS